MCSPVSVVSGGKVNSCVGICQVWPYIIGMTGLGGVLAWNLKDSVVKSKSTETAEEN